jgi:hypothetical protein
MVEADEANTKAAPVLMANLHPLAVQLFDDAEDLFRYLYKALENWKAETAINEQLETIADAHGLSTQELAGRLQQGTAADIPEAQDLFKRLWTLRVVRMIVAACQRYWAWGSLDLFRLRITAAHGNLRLEAEAMALIVLFMGDDDLAEQWSRLYGDKEGYKFFKKTQPAVKTILAKYDLGRTYGIASGAAQHVRMASIVRALSTSDGVITLPDQDFDKADSYSFHLAIAHFHRIQQRILSALGATLLAGDETWTAMDGSFAKRAGDLWAVLEKRYAKEIHEPGRNTEEAASDGGG